MNRSWGVLPSHVPGTLLPSGLSLVVGLVLYISSINDEVMNRPSSSEQYFHYRYGWSFAFAASSFLLKEVMCWAQNYQFEGGGGDVGVFQLLGVWSRWDLKIGPFGFVARKQTNKQTSLRIGPSEVLEVGVLVSQREGAPGLDSLKRRRSDPCAQEEKNSLGYGSVPERKESGSSSSWGS